MIHEARALEERGEIAAAYDKYRQGMTVILEAVSQLSDEDPLASSSRQKVATYLEHAEGLKVQLEEPIGKEREEDPPSPPPLDEQEMAASFP